MALVSLFAVLATVALAFGTAACRLRLPHSGMRALFLGGTLQSGSLVCDGLLTFLDSRTELVGAGVLGGLLLGLGCFFLVVAAVELAQAQQPRPEKETAAAPPAGDEQPTAGGAPN